MDWDIKTIVSIVHKKFLLKKIKGESVLQFIKFGVVGLSNTFISYVVYATIVYFGIYYIVASVISFIVSVLNSFCWNNKFVFKNGIKKHNFFGVLLKFYLTYGFTGLLISNILLFLQVSVFNISVYIAPLFCLAITIPLNFILNKFWVFKT